MKTVIALTAGVLVTSHVAATTVVLNETFDDKTGFTTSTALFSDGGSDYFGLTGGTADFGAGSAPSGIPSFTGTTGSYLVGEDMDAEGASLPVTVTWSGLDISGLTSLTFTGDFGASSGIDSTDDMILEASIDSGSYFTVLDFDFLPDGDTFNSVFTLAGGTSPTDDLGLALKEFSTGIAGTGSTLDLRLSVSLNSGSEEFAVDNFSVTGVPEPGSLALLALGGLLITRRRRG